MIGRDLRTLHASRSVTMGDLAASLGWSVSHLSHVEREVWPACNDEVHAIVSDLARIVRERTPVATIAAPDGAP